MKMNSKQCTNRTVQNKLYVAVLSFSLLERQFDVVVSSVPALQKLEHMTCVVSASFILPAYLR